MENTKKKMLLNSLKNVAMFSPIAISIGTTFMSINGAIGGSLGGGVGTAVGTAIGGLVGLACGGYGVVLGIPIGAALGGGIGTAAGMAIGAISTGVFATVACGAVSATAVTTLLLRQGFFRNSAEEENSVALNDIEQQTSRTKLTSR